MVNIVAVITPIAGQEGALKEALKGVIETTHKEKGCLLYSLHESVDGPKRFVFIEKWESQEALQAHLNSAHVQQAFALKGKLFSDIEIIPLKGLSFGTSTQGSL